MAIFMELKRSEGRGLRGFSELTDEAILMTGISIWVSILFMFWQ
jgi:hypothetical protein